MGLREGATTLVKLLAARLKRHGGQTFRAAEMEATHRTPA